MGKAEEFGFFLTRTFATTRKTKREWPFIPGKYLVRDIAAPVAVTAPGSVEPARRVYYLAPAGPVRSPALHSIAAAMTKKYSRPVTASAKANPTLLAGLRVRVGSDVYESTVAGQLANLSL